MSERPWLGVAACWMAVLLVAGYFYFLCYTAIPYDAGILVHVGAFLQPPLWTALGVMFLFMFPEYHRALREAGRAEEAKALLR